jgi:hypothetical protein
MPIVIDDEKVIQLLREEAEQTGESFDEIIVRVLRNKLDELDRAKREASSEGSSPPT